VQSHAPPLRCSGEPAPRLFVYSAAASVCAHQLCGGALPFDVILLRFRPLHSSYRASSVSPWQVPVSSPAYLEARAPRRLGMASVAISAPGVAACARGAWPAWPAACAARGQPTVSTNSAWPACPRITRAPSVWPACGRRAHDSLARPRRSLTCILRNPSVSSLPSSSVSAEAPAQSVRHSGSLAVTSRRARNTSSCLATSSSGRMPSLQGEHRPRVGNLASLCCAF
jgi:hypothetical protein